MPTLLALHVTYSRNKCLNVLQSAELMYVSQQRELSEMATSCLVSGTTLPISHSALLLARLSATLCYTPHFTAVVALAKSVFFKFILQVPVLDQKCNMGYCHTALYVQ